MLRVVRARWRYGSAAPFLLYRVESSDVREACCAVRAVVRLLAHEAPHSLESRELRGSLATALGSARREVRVEAVRALGCLDHPDALVALSPHLSTLAKQSERKLLVASLATMLVTLLFAPTLDGLAPADMRVALLMLLSYGSTTGLVFGCVRLIAQRFSGSRLELEQVLAACSAQDPEQIAGIREELRRIASPVAGQSQEAQRHARELLRRVKKHEIERGSLPIAASVLETPYEELPTPAAAPQRPAAPTEPAKVC
jgi:hypothetical protein